MTLVSAKRHGLIYFRFRTITSQSNTAQLWKWKCPEEIAGFFGITSASTAHTTEREFSNSLPVSIQDAGSKRLVIGDVFNKIGCL